MRYKKGCPKRLYLVVCNDTGDMWSFTSMRQRKWWIEENPGNYSLGAYTLED